MLLAWPEKAKNQYRDLRVFSHRSRVPPQANKFLFIDISDVNPLAPASVHTSLCLPPRGSGSKRKRTIRPRLGYDTFLGSIWNAGKNGAWIPYQPADDDGNEVPPAPTVTFMGRKLPMVKTAFGRSLPVVPIPPERHGTGLRNRKNRHSQ